MSAITPGVPYVAPWATGFNRYAVQPFTFKLVANHTSTLTVPSGQWYRPMVIYGSYTTNGAAATRQIQLQITAPSFGVALTLSPPASVGASSELKFVYGPNLTTFADTAIATDIASVIAIPDLLWQFGTVFKFETQSFQGGDPGYSAVQMVAEVYTEDYNTGQLVPVATPTIG